MATASKKPPSGGVGRVATEAGSPSPASSPSRSTKPSPPVGHVRRGSTRTSATPVSARSAVARRDSSDARAETASALEDLQQRLQKEEKLSEQYRAQAEVLQSKHDETLTEAAKAEEKIHELEEQLEALRNEKKVAVQEKQDMVRYYEAAQDAFEKERGKTARRLEEMELTNQRLKKNLAQRNNNEESRRSRPGNSSPSLVSDSFAPPSMQRSDSRNNSRLVLEKDELIMALQIELAEAQGELAKRRENADLETEIDSKKETKLETKHDLEKEDDAPSGDPEDPVKRLEHDLKEVREANARLMEENKSYELLLQEKTLKGHFGQSDFSYMGASANEDALNALEGKSGGMSLADELSDATEAESESYRRLEADLKSMKEQNKALTLYINKIIERLLQHQDFESILDQSGEAKTGPVPVNTNKDLPAAPGNDAPNTNPSLLQRAASIVGPSKSKPRPLSFMPSAANSAHTDPETAPSIPIGRSASTRRAASRPQSEQFAPSFVSQLYRGPEGPVSPSLGNRHSQSYFAHPSLTSNPNVAARYPSGSQGSSGNFPGMRSETSSVSGDSGDLSTSTPPSQSPPRSHSDKQTTFSGSKPRPLRLVQENQDAFKDSNKRASWYSGWSWGAKKDEAQPGAGATTNNNNNTTTASTTTAAIPE